MNAEGERAAETAATGPKWPIRTLCAVVALEALVMVAVTVLLVVEVLTQPALSFSSSIALIVLAGLAAVLLIALMIGIYLEQRWVRGLTAVWQVLQVPAAITIIRGDMVQPLGWGLAVASLVGLLLIFHPAVGSRLK